jgi:halocyanin-like protein
MPADTTTRRLFITASTTAAIGAVAGCGSDGQNPEDPGGAESTPEGNNGDADGAPSGVEDYLSGVGNFDGNVQDKTDQGEVTIEVGVEANGGNFGYSPAAVRISTGTTVVWEWTGKGGSHDVVAEDEGFQSDLVAEAGHTFEHTFESEGIRKYYCTPHKSLGMKGVILAE